MLNFIQGQWRPSATADFLSIHNPATGEPLARTPLSTTAELNEAVDAASALSRPGGASRSPTASSSSSS